MKKDDVPRRKNLQFSQDDMKRFLAASINAALEHFTDTQIVEGVSIISLGEEVWRVGFLVGDNQSKTTWGFAISILPQKEETDD